MFSNQPRNSRRRSLFSCMLISAMLTAGAVAIENKPLPSFEVQSAAGSRVSSSTWKRQGKWVLIYLEGQCAPCTHLLARLTKDKYPQLANQTVIVVGGVRTGDIRAIQKAFPDLAQATWYADPERNAPKALELHGAPVTFGIEDKTLRWAISGIPPSPRLLPSVLKKWSAQQDAAPSSVTTTPSNPK